MSEPLEALERANAYLKLRVAQLTEDVTALTAENERLRQQREHLHNRQTAKRPDPLGGGQ